jgi:aryl-alcohol dehydrogenase-like predicted oxidoreductase
MPPPRHRVRAVLPAGLATRRGQSRADQPGGGPHRLGVTPAQVALAWLLQLAPNVLLIPGTGTVAHLRENLAAEDVVLDGAALRTLDGMPGR